MSANARFLLMGAFFLSSAMACVDRARGEEEDEIERMCAKSCPRQFECDYAQEGMTLEKCLKKCPEEERRRRDKCEAHFEMSLCLSSLSCDEYFEYADVIKHLDRWPSEYPGFPCQEEVVTEGRECYGVEPP